MRDFTFHKLDASAIGACSGGLHSACTLRFRLLGVFVHEPVEEVGDGVERQVGGRCDWPRS